MEIFPEIDLFPRITKVAHFLGSLVTLPNGGYPSEYPKHPERRGAEAMLSEPTDGEAYQPRLWD